MVKKIDKFLEFYNAKTPNELYHTEIRIVDVDYDVELNGVLINHVSKGNGDYLICNMMNNRRIRLHISEDTQFLINGEEL
jgi:hypothetical protein